MTFGGTTIWNYDTGRYLVLALAPGEEHAVEAVEARNLKIARPTAYRLALQMRPRGMAQPVWRGAYAWHDHPDAPDRRPVGGYDCGNGHAAVVFLRLRYTGTRRDAAITAARTRRSWRRRRTYWRDPNKRSPRSGEFTADVKWRREERNATRKALNELAELRARPTIFSGHTADLKIDTGRLRVWVVRTPPVKGGPRPFLIERKENEGWVDVTDELVARWQWKD